MCLIISKVKLNLFRGTIKKQVKSRTANEAHIRFKQSEFLGPLSVCKILQCLSVLLTEQGNWRSKATNGL